MKLIFAILLFSILGVTMTGCHRDVVVVPMLVDVNSALKLRIIGENFKRCWITTVKKNPIQ